MKKQLFLLLVCLFSGLTQVWAQDADLTNVFTQDENLTVNSVTNDVTYPWIIDDNGWLSTPSYNRNNLISVIYDVTLEKASILSFDYDVKVYSSSDYLEVNIDGISRFYKTVTSSGNTSIIINEGQHEITLYFKNYYSQTTSYGKIKNVNVTTIDSQNININLETPGTLGLEVLSHVSTLPTAKYLKLSGNLNDADWATLKQMTGLQSLDMEDANVEEIPANAFYKNSSSEGIPLKRFVFPKTLKSIGASAFYHNRAHDPLLTNDLKLPEGLEEIGASAFYANNLMSCTLPQSVKTLENSIFYNNVYFKTITLNNNITSLPTSIFDGCERLETINGIDRITSFGSCCLHNCYKITSLGAAKPVYISDRAFYQSGLTEFNGEEVLTIGYSAFYSTSITEAILPKVTSIAYNAFDYCRSLVKFVSSDVLTSLPSYCFRSCSALEYVSLGASITTHDSYVFAGCNNIKKVYCNAPTPMNVNTSYWLFETSIPPKATLYVPNYASISYKLDTYWSKFATVEDNTNIVTDIKLSTTLELASNARIPNTPNLSMLYSNSKLTINGSAEQPLNHFLGYYGTITGTNIGTSSLVNRSNNMTSLSSEIRYRMNSGSSTSYWYFVCMPFNVNMSDITSTVGADFVVRYYDGASRASTETSSGNWKNMPADGVLEAGKGYIFRVSQSNGYLSLPATEETHNQIFASSTISTPLEVHESATSANSNWNLVGNPYPSYYDIYYMDYTAPITVFNNGSYYAYSIADDDYVLSPLQAFFVQKPDAFSAISFNPLGRQHSSTVQRASAAKTRQTSVSRSIINLTLSDGTCEDMTRVVVNSAIGDEYNADCDAAKMLNLDTNPQLYTLAEDGMYAINEGAHQSGEIKIGMWFPDNGTFTISAPRTDCPIEMYDNGELVSLPYTFAASAGYSDSRFTMVLKSGAATTINGVEKSTSAEMFDLTGRRINDTSRKGMYIINNQKVIK